MSEEKKLPCFSNHGTIEDCSVCSLRLSCYEETNYVTGKSMPRAKTPVGSIKEAPKRDNEEAKPRMAYLPMDLLEKVVAAYELGNAKEYPRNSWRQGFSVSRLISAARRHDSDFWDKGETFDKQALEEYGIEVYHSACVIFNHLCILDTLINHPELDDRHKILNQGEKDKE